jgi:hypothetical protein
MPFVKGKSGNPKGRPVKQVNYLGAILSTTTEEDVVEVFQKLLIKAKSGDIAATKIVLEYLAGKPKEQLEISNPDGTMKQRTTIIFSNGIKRDGNNDTSKV